MGRKLKPTERRKLMRERRKAYRLAEQHQFAADAFRALGRELEKKLEKLGVK